MLPDKDILMPLIEEAAQKAIEIRRDLHMHPEVSSHEERTAKVIADTLKDLGVETRFSHEALSLAVGVGGDKRKFRCLKYIPECFLISMRYIN